jgi:hypothetical protein
VTDLGFQGRFTAGLSIELSFCLSSISPFHKKLLSNAFKCIKEILGNDFFFCLKLKSSKFIKKLFSEGN